MTGLVSPFFRDPVHIAKCQIKCQFSMFTLAGITGDFPVFQCNAELQIAPAQNRPDPGVSSSRKSQVLYVTDSNDLKLNEFFFSL